MANTPSATSCSGVITDHLLVKCLNLIFHFNLRVFQHDIAGSLPTKLVWYHLNPLDLVSHLPLSLSSYINKKHWGLIGVTLVGSE